MTPLALRIKNFRSFKAEQRFDFPQAPGLYFMQGLNEVEPRLGANGAGKTTIWEALTWCLYGVTADGLKAGDVCNWDAGKGTEVAFIFMLADGEPCMVRRTWGPISWTLHRGDENSDSLETVVTDLTKDKANPVLAWLRLELEPWLNSVLTAQGRPMFLDIKQEAQAGLFSEVLGLERWVEYSQRASKRASAQDAVTRELERRHARLAGELESTIKQDFAAQHDDWEVARLKKLLNVNADHKEGMAKRAKLKAELAAAEEAEVNARARVSRALPNAALVEDVGVMRGYAADYSMLLRDAERDLEREQEHAKHVAENKTCPTCGQDVAGGAHAIKARKRIERLELEVKKWTRELLGARKRLDELEAELEKEEAEEGRARDALDGAQRAVSSARRALDLQERELDRIEDEAERLEVEENPFAKMARQATRNASRLREELAEAQDRLDASNARYGLLSYWVRGFKELRLQQIAEALTELEIEVNSAVTALGLVGWELRFAVDKEGKGGSIQRGFSVTVRSPHYPQPTPWRAWSGGEKQRLRLAANMGLADLIRSRTGTGLNLEVWDEPTNGLSPQGWGDLLESLAARARNEGRLIFVTDHKAHDYGGFAGTATVIKRPSGSAIRTTWGKGV